MTSTTKTDRRVRVLRTTYRRGYGRDHVVRDSDYDEMAGRVYPSRKAAEQEADRLCQDYIAGWSIEYANDLAPSAEEVERAVDGYIERHPHASVTGRSEPRLQGDQWVVDVTDEERPHPCLVTVAVR